MTEAKPRLRRSEVPDYLDRKFGLPVSKTTLNKWATVGGGPPMRYFGRIPLYDTDDLDAWAEARMSKPVASTSGRRKSNATSQRALA